MNIYTDNALLRQKVTDIINSLKNRYIPILRCHHPELWQWVIDEVEYNFPNNNETESAKLYLALNPDTQLVCPYGRPQKFTEYRMGYKCSNRYCACIRDKINDTRSNRYGISKKKQRQIALKNAIKNDEFYIAQLIDIINGGNNYTKYIKLVPGCINWINHKIDSLFPNNNFNLLAKVYLLLNPETKLICPYNGNKIFKGYQSGFSCKRGCECIRKKSEAASHEKYQTTNPAKNPEIRKKISKAKKEDPNKPAIRKKTEDTNIDRYGTKTPGENEDIKNKIKNSHIVRSKDEVKKSVAKRKATNLETCGREFIRQSHISNDVWNILNDKVLFANILSKTSVTALSKDFGISTSYIYSLHKKYNLKIIKPCKSMYENELCSWLNLFGFDFKRDRKILDGKELDAYYPDHNFAIEFNGDYWHMNPRFYESNHKIRNEKTAEQIWEYDKWKYDTCLSKGIYLMQIWEDDWNNNKDQIKQKILKYLGIKNLILNEMTK